MASHNLSSLLNRSAASVVMEQMRKLYMRLYPHMVSDFAHIGDVDEALRQIDMKLDILLGLISSQNPVGLTIPVLPPTVMTNYIAESLVLLPGYPQPTGEATPAIIPSRIGTPAEIVAVPPLSPADITGTGAV